MTYFLGYDGGGTKTACLLLDEQGAVAGRGVAGPSNPNRIGFETAFESLRAAANHALAAAEAETRQVRGVCAGLAGAGSARVVKRVMGFLVSVFPNAVVHVTTDSAVTLEAAAGEGPGVVLIAGTGSVCLGRNAAGQTARAGGMGPWISDEGSAFDMGRRAVIAVSRARDALAPVTLLSETIPAALELPSWEALIERIYTAPDQVFPQIYPLVVQAAAAGDAPACEVLLAGATGLAGIAGSVIRRLELQEKEFVLAKSGGVFGHSEIFENALDALLRSAAPKAQIQRLDVPPAMGAARWAMRLTAEGDRERHDVQA
jgi:N-acetylglucosamine kinase